MTQPKFPWVLLVIIAMFTFIAVDPKSPPWIVVLAIIAALLAAAAAVYQVIPRKDDTYVDNPESDDMPSDGGAGPE